MCGAMDKEADLISASIDVFMNVTLELPKLLDVEAIG
jgi:hypothetical protein